MTGPGGRAEGRAVAATTAATTGRLSIARRDMGEWKDVGSGLEARRQGELVEARLSDPGKTWRHDQQGRLLAMTREQAVNTAARPPDWVHVGGTYESRYVTGQFQIRGKAVSDMVRHDENGRLASVDDSTMSRILLLSQ